MKRGSVLFILVVFLVFATSANIYAADDDEKKVDEVSADLDKNSHETGEAKKVEARLEDRFGVTDTQVDNLRRQKLGYGEISTIFSLTKQMPGGINDENIQKITDMRQGDGHKTGWGKIAQELGVKLGPAIADADHIRPEAREERMENRKGSQPKESGVREYRGAGRGSSSGSSMKSQMPSGSRGGGRGHR